MSRLNKAHLRDLRKSGISDESVEACGLHSASSSEVQVHLGFIAGPGLVFPYPDTIGKEGVILHRVKLDDPTSSMKYASPSKSTYSAGNRLYVCPLMDERALHDPGIEFLITEGEKKAIKCCQDGFPTIGLSGVWNWKGKDQQGRKGPIPDLDSINFADRSVGIVFDSDAKSNSSVKAAEDALFRELKRRGASPFVVRLPSPNRSEKEVWGTKFGVDDFLVARGTDAFQRLLDEARCELPLGCRPVTVLEDLPESPRPWLIDEIWKVGDCGFVAGPPKTKKSLLVLDLAIAIVTDDRFLGRDVAQGCVIVADEETNRHEFRTRLKQLAAGRGLALADLPDIHFLEKGLLRIDRAESLEELKKLSKLLRPILLILDPFVRLHQRDENSSQEISPMLRDLRGISDEFDLSIMVVHHFGKGHTGENATRMRGTSDLNGWMDAAIYTTNKSGNIELAFDYRYGSPRDNMTIQLVQLGENAIGWQHAGSNAEKHKETKASLIVQALEISPRGSTELSQIAGCSGTIVNTILKRLEAESVIEFFKQKNPRGRPTKMARLLRKQPDLISDTFSDLKKEKEVSNYDHVPVGPDVVAGPDPSGDVTTDNGVSDSASALTGSSCVRNTLTTEPTDDPWTDVDPEPDPVDSDTEEMGDESAD